MLHHFFKSILLLFFALFTTTNSNAREKLSQTTFQEESLFYAGKVWGFVKYYHPEARLGKFDIDSSLVVLLDKVSETKNLKERNTVLSQWVASFGKITAFEKFVVKDSSNYRFYDYSWLENKTFDKKLSKQLIDIKNAKRTDNCYYTSTKLGVGNIFFTNEKQDSLDLKVLNNRLLPLIRYWNMVEYFFPYKYLMGKDWNEVLKRNIPEFLASKSLYVLNGAIQRLTAELNDGHSGLRNYPYLGFFKKYYVPIDFKYINDKFIVTNLVKNSKQELIKNTGLEIGDIILSINGNNPDSIMKSVHGKALAHSNTNFLNSAYGFLLFKSDTTFVDVICQRDGQPMEVKVMAWNQNVIPFIERKDPVKVLDGNIGYIYPAIISPNVIDSMMSVIKDTKGLIIDMRCYPMGDFNNFMNSFLTDTVMSPQFSFINNQYPGIFNIVRSRPVFNEKIKDRYTNPIVLLVNHSTISKPEYMILFMQGNKNVTTIGSQTGGANGDVSGVPLQNKMYAAFSGYGVHYSDGSDMQRVGVRIDETVYPTIEDIKKGTDRVLERAIEILKAK